LTFKKLVAQVGVLLYISSSIVPFAGIQHISSVVWPLTSLLAILLFILVAVIPSKPDDVFGSMWPLVGYDNAIDALYVRGPWMVRFQEMDELDRQRNIASGMKSLFE